MKTSSANLFRLFLMHFGKKDYREFKKHLNACLEQSMSRKLNPSKLDSFASSILGSNNPNTLASALDNQSGEDLLELYKKRLFDACELVGTESTSSRMGLIPLVTIKVKGKSSMEAVITLSSDVSFINGQLSSSAFVTAELTDSKAHLREDTPMGEFEENGGVTLQSLFWGSSYDGVAVKLEALFDSLEVMQWKASFSAVALNALGMDKSAFNRLKGYSDLTDALESMHQMVFFELYSSMIRKGFILNKANMEDNLEIYSDLKVKQA